MKELEILSVTDFIKHYRRKWTEDIERMIFDITIKKYVV
jgi:hypothetical protein